jgi:(p)ppGpp synthase/HD superfamily hydrolase
VAQLVAECTEQGTGGEVKAPWKERKDAYLAHIRVASSGALLISVADKLQSLREL